VDTDTAGQRQRTSALCLSLFLGRKLQPDEEQVITDPDFHESITSDTGRNEQRRNEFGVLKGCRQLEVIVKDWEVAK
jgi:hypothetical protein